jgi:hypothetical protein
MVTVVVLIALPAIQTRETQSVFASSQLFLQLFSRKVAIAQDLGQQATSNCFAAMYRHDCATPIGVLEEMVAAPDANHLESQLAQSPDKL